MRQAENELVLPYREALKTYQERYDAYHAVQQFLDNQQKAEQESELGRLADQLSTNKASIEAFQQTILSVELLTLVHDYRKFKESGESLAHVTASNVASTFPPSLNETALFYIILQRQILNPGAESFEQSLENMMNQAVVGWLRTSSSKPVWGAWQSMMTGLYPNSQSVLDLIGETYMPTYMGQSVLAALMAQDKAKDGEKPGKRLVYARTPKKQTPNPYAKELKERLLSTVTLFAQCADDSANVPTGLLQEMTELKMQAKRLLTDLTLDETYNIYDPSPAQATETARKLQAALASSKYSERQRQFFSGSFRSSNDRPLVWLQLFLQSVCCEKKLNAVLTSAEQFPQAAPFLYSMQETELKMIQELQIF